MSYIEEMLEYNRKFVENGAYASYETTKFPDKKIAVLSCMDTRLTGLLPAALNLKSGDVKIIKTAGGFITNPFGGVMRSLLIAVYEFLVEDILVIGHLDCGMEGMDISRLMNKMRDRGVSQKTVHMLRYCGVDLDRWLTGFGNVEKSVSETVQIIKNHPLMPDDVRVWGFIMHPGTGKLDRIT